MVPAPTEGEDSSNEPTPTEDEDSCGTDAAYVKHLGLFHDAMATMYEVKMDEGYAKALEADIVALHEEIAAWKRLFSASPTHNLQPDDIVIMDWQTIDYLRDEFNVRTDVDAEDIAERCGGCDFYDDWQQIVENGGYTSEY